MIKVHGRQRGVALVPDVMFYELPPKASGIAFRERAWALKLRLVPDTREASR